MSTPGPHDRPQPDGSDRRAVRGEDVPALAATLARAFEHNPGMSWAYRNERERLIRIARGFALFMDKVWVPQGGCLTTNGLDGAALWMPPGTWHLPLVSQLRLMPGIVAAARGDTPRILRFFAIADSKHPREPHWYLAVLGVDPSRQGRGYGSHLMQPVLERCDTERLPAYLETDTERNVTLYERHGFEVTERFPLPGGGPPLWLMWREPVVSRQ